MIPTLSAQNPAQPVTTGSGNAQQDQTDAARLPPTPAQEHDQQIREIDPLDRTDKEKDDAKAVRDAETRREREQTPTPGSIAATERQNSAQRSGPNVVDDDAEGTPVQEYSGPAVLSRSYSVNRPLIPEQIKWQESVGLSSVYDTGISRRVNPDGSLGNPSTLTGGEFTWSLSGRHYFRRDVVGVLYSGNVTRYSGSGGYNGTNQSVTVDYSHVLTRRLAVNFSGSGSILAQNYALENPAVGADTIANISLASSPNIQIFDTGAKQFSGQADLTWRKTSRLSFNLGTSYFGISRDSALLLGVTGQQFRGDVNYRLTRKTTVGSYYSYSHYLYPHGAGDSDINTLGMIFSYAISRTMQIRFRGGVSRIESLGQQTVRIDPAIAALLGQSSGIVDSYQILRTSDLSAQLVKDFGRGTTVSLAYARGISPGNGVFQTSRQESISGNVTLRLKRNASLQTSFGRDTLGSVGQALGEFKSDSARISLSRTYRRGFGLSLAAEYRHFDIVNFASIRNQLRITTGFTWSPTTGRLWPF